MRALVDTSVWVEYLRRTESPHDVWLDSALRAGDEIGWTEPVLYELLAGARTAGDVTGIRSLLAVGTPVTVAGVADWEDAAALQRRAMRTGRAVRSALDCLVAAVAIRSEVPVLARDRDFELLAEVSDLELIAP